MSSGAYIDSLRFRVHLAERLGVSPASVDAQILGEHGKSAVFLWSAARVQGVPILQALRQRGVTVEDLQASIERDVRDANIAIIEGNDASQFGIGMVSARIAEMVLRDEREVIPIGSYVAKYGVTLSLPSIVGRHGAIRASNVRGGGEGIGAQCGDITECVAPRRHSKARSMKRSRASCRHMSDCGPA